MKLSQKLTEKLDSKLGEKSWYISLKHDYVFRTLVFSGWGTLITFAFTLYNGIFCVLKNSLWHGVFAIYLFVLALQRALLLLIYGNIQKRCGNDAQKLNLAKLKIYLANGAVFLPISLALFVIILLMLNLQKPVVSNGILAIVTAAYSFYKITMAIINSVKANSHRDKLVQTIRNVCLVDAVVSIILLESTLITTFGTLTQQLYLLMALTGLAACVFALSVGIFMIISAAKLLKTQ